MTKTFITPENNNIFLSVPEEYIGKKIEVLMYAVDEVDELKTETTMAEFEGILSEDEANQLQEYVKQSREEWG